MAYRRRAGMSKAATFKDDMLHNHNHPTSSSRSPFEEGEEDDDGDDHDHDHDHNHHHSASKKKGNESASATTSLGARATRASAAHRDSSGYAYAYGGHRHSDHFRSLSFPKVQVQGSPSPHLHTHSHSQSDIGSASGSGSTTSSSMSMSMSMMTTNSVSVSPKHGFWGVLATKAKSILEDEHQHQPRHSSHHHHHHDTNYRTSTTHNNQMYPSSQSSDRDSSPKPDNARLRNRLDAITSSFNNFGDSLGNAFEEGRSLMENKTSDIIQETRTRTAEFIQGTRKLQLRRRGPSSEAFDQPTVVQNTSWQRPVGPSVQTNSVNNQQTQLKASRDVAMATAAKAKLLLRELKTVKADLAFAKERCSQLEEENKRLRLNREKGDNPADDDLIRLQLETLLAEKARLAHENSMYARENRFLREIVEYHQLSMQDVVYLDEGDEEVTEGYPFSIDDANVLPSTSMSPLSASFLPEVSSLSMLPEEKEHIMEAPEDVSIASSFSFPSTAPTDYPTSCPPERTKSSELVIDEETETHGDTEPSIDAYDAPKTSSVLSP